MAEKTMINVKWQIFHLSIIVMMLSNLIFGQNRPIVTLDEAIKQSLLNNQDILIQKNNLKISFYKIKEAYSKLLPSLNSFGQFKIRKGGQFIEQRGEFVVDAKTENFFGSFDASLDIFNGFKNINSIKESKNNKEAQELLLQRTEQDVILQISTQYLKCLISKELITIFQNNLETQQKILEKVENESNLGKRAEIDFLLQQAEVERLELNVLKAEGVYHNDKLLLTRLLGQEPTGNISVIEPLLISKNAFESDNKTINFLYNLALNQRADLLRANVITKSAKNRIGIQGASILPSLSTFYRFNTGFNSGYIDAFSKQIDDNLLNEYGLSLSIPLFGNLKGRSARQQAKVDFFNSELEKEKLELQIKQQIALAHQNYLEAIKSLELTKKQLVYAEQVYYLETERFNLGISDIKRYSEATDDIIKTRSDAVQAKYTLMFQEIFLKYTVGGLKDNNI